MLKALFLCMSMAFAVACTTAGTALTPHEQEAAALVTATAAVKSADQLLVAGKITGAEARSVKSQADAVVALVSAARALPAGSAGLGNDLSQIAALLAGLQTYLTNAQVPK